MIEIIMQVPDNLAQRLQPLYNWLPTVLEDTAGKFKGSEHAHVRTGRKAARRHACLLNLSV